MQESSLRKLARIMVIVMLIISSQGIVPIGVLAETVSSDEIDEAEQDVSEEVVETTGVASTPYASTPLRIGVTDVQGDFSFFFGETAQDRRIAGLTQLETLTNDRNGDIIYQGIEGEIRSYNGADYSYFGPANLDVTVDEANYATAYTWTLRSDLKFSDGTPLTVDDLIFTFYVLADPAYSGPSTFNTLPIRGMNEYRTQTSSLVYEKYASLWNEIVTAGPEHELTDVSWTKDMEDRVWGDLEAAALEGLELVINYVDSHYTALYGEGLIGRSVEEIREDGLLTALAMSLWGFGQFTYEDPDAEDQGADVSEAEDPDADVQDTEAMESDDPSPSAVATGYLFNDKSWNFEQGEYPDVHDFLEGALELYDGDYVALMQSETAGVGGKQADKIKEEFITTYGALDEDQEGGVAAISGISRLSDTQVEIVLNGYDATAVYKQIVPITPLHIYGDAEAYDYENQNFGFTLGDLSKVQAQSDHPVGAGPYIFQGYDEGVISFTANPYYYRGEPKTKQLYFVETDPGEMVSAIDEDRIDISEPVFSKAIAAEIEDLSDSAAVSSNGLDTAIYDDLGYGYIGLNAATVNVGGIPGSEASKNLRRALATVFASQRRVAIDAYFGDTARIIEYPISSTSWAAPQPSDEGYEYAYTTDIHGEAIYTTGMDDLSHTKATLQAASGYLLAAGFTQEDGIFTEAPEGAKLEYEVIVPGDGKADHPSYTIVEEAADLLSEIGITLTIVDPQNPGILWDKLQDGSAEIWCAAWNGSIDPDMHQVYHSSNIVGKGGTGSNYYHIADDHLDELILAARTNSDRVFRRETYREALGIVLDWAVEVPVYQRQQINIFSAERIDMRTVTANQTSFYDWMSEIQNIEMN